MVRRTIPLYLSSSPDSGAKHTTDRGDEFTISLQPPITVPSRDSNGRPIQATIACHALDVINSFHNVDDGDNTVVVSQELTVSARLKATVAVDFVALDNEDGDSAISIAT